MLNESFGQIVDGCKGTPRSHVPSFRIAPADSGTTIFDGDRAIAMVFDEAIDIWSFSPFESDVAANPPRVSTTLDVHTVRNTWLSMGAHWPKQLQAKRPGMRWVWSRPSGESLEATATVQTAEGEYGKWVFKIRFDPTWGRYRYTWDIDARLLSPEGMEAFNMMITHALADREKTRRWTHTVSPDAHGKLVRIPNSNALFLTHRLPAQRHTHFPQSWVGYLGHASFNPVTIIEHSNTPIVLGFCDQLFDQHLTWTTPGMDNLENDGFFHSRMSVEFANLRADVARTMIDRAADPVRTQPVLGKRQGRIAIPFHMDQVNSFEEEVDPWAPVDCPIVVVDPAESGTIDRDAAVAHTGRCSLRLTGHAPTDRHELYPIGAVCLVRPHTQYKLAGWVRTRGVRGFARLELATIEYTYVNVIEVAASPHVRADSEWTRVEVILNTREKAYVLPKMILEGVGEAWFDDLALTELGAASETTGDVRAGNKQPETAAVV